MPVVTRDAIRALAGFRGQRAPVTTCYLDVDGRHHVRHQDYEHELDVLLRRVRSQANGNGSVAADLRRIEEYVRRGIDRSATRGLAMFACSAHGLWEVVRLPVPVRSRVVIDAAPALGQLELVVQHHPSVGVLLADRQRARIFVFDLGELTEWSELFEELPRDYDERGRQDTGDTQHHVDELASQHLRHAAAVAWHVWKDHGFEHLVLAAPEEVTHALAGALHPYLRDRLAARVVLPVTASQDEVWAAALDAQRSVRLAEQAAWVARLREAVSSGRKGVAGLGPVLAAVGERRVERLLVSEGFAQAGWRCGQCGRLAAVGRVCPVCNHEMERLDDVVEHAIEDSLAQSCRIVMCSGNADLDVLGRIGALLRY